MKPFAAVLKAYRAWINSYAWVRLLLPYHLHLLFGGLVLLFLHKLLYETMPYSSYRTLQFLFHTIPLYIVAYYGFFLGIWLTLATRDLPLLPYALWGYAFVILFPFRGLDLHMLVSAAIYVGLGWAVYRFAASSEAFSDSNPTLSV